MDDGLPENQYFKRLHSISLTSSSIGSNVKEIIRDYTRKTAAMLPPATRDATIAIRYDDETPCYGRALVSGPLGSAYFGGLFLFDIYLPKDYPNVPPQVLNCSL